MNPFQDRIVRACLPIFAVLCCGTIRAQDPATPPPNVVFFFADDQRPDTIGALGNPGVITVAFDPSTPIVGMAAVTPQTSAVLAPGLEVDVRFAQFLALLRDRMA